MPGFGGAGGFTSASAFLRANARENEKKEDSMGGKKKRKRINPTTKLHVEN